jgi:hypothetical protein
MLTTMTANARQYDWGTWMIGIMRSFISGGAGAFASGTGAMVLAPDKFNVSGHFGNTLALMGFCFFIAGAYRLAEFLTLHGAPDPYAPAPEQQKQP